MQQGDCYAGGNEQQQSSARERDQRRCKAVWRK